MGFTRYGHLSEVVGLNISALPNRERFVWRNLGHWETLAPPIAIPNRAAATTTPLLTEDCNGLRFEQQRFRFVPMLEQHTVRRRFVPDGEYGHDNAPGTGSAIKAGVLKLNFFSGNKRVPLGYRAGMVDQRFEICDATLPRTIFFFPDQSVWTTGGESLISSAFKLSSSIVDSCVARVWRSPLSRRCRRGLDIGLSSTDSLLVPPSEPFTSGRLAFTCTNSAFRSPSASSSALPTDFSLPSRSFSATRRVLVMPKFSRCKPTSWLSRALKPPNFAGAAPKPVAAGRGGTVAVD
uniref:Uncharacterized protein n=1 Tax=Anopheles farauti TaxID=69004 RepID=A0A182QPQ4_9DIPT